MVPVAHGAARPTAHPDPGRGAAVQEAISQLSAYAWPFCKALPPWASGAPREMGGQPPHPSCWEVDPQQHLEAAAAVVCEGHCPLQTVTPRVAPGSASLGGDPPLT